MCARAAPALLAHVNLLLTLYGGAALATAARLKWDPSTYVVVRELFPAEYPAAAAALAAGGAALLLLPHLAAAAHYYAAPRAARILLYVYAALMSVVMAGELVFGAWLALQVAAWLRSPAAAQLADALQLSEHLRAVLRFIGRWHPLPQRIDALIQEAEDDAPRNAYAALALGALLALLQPLAAALALLAACRRRPRTLSDSELPLQPRPPSYNRRYATVQFQINPTNNSGKKHAYSYQKMPRTAYKNGRIVVVGPRRQ